MRKSCLLLVLSWLIIAVGCEEKIVTQEEPVIQISGTELVVPGNGGEVCVYYEIINPAVDGELKAVPSDDWMHDFKNVSDTLVTFMADPNDSGSERTGSITLSYIYGSGQSVSEEINVRQTVVGAEPTIVLSVSDPVPAEGGEVILKYEITDPVEGGVVSASSEAAWVEDITCPQDGTLHLTVQANEGAEREASLTVTYAYDGKEVNAEGTVVQEAAAAQEYDFEYEFTLMSGVYYGQNGYNGEYNFYTVFSDVPLDEYGEMQNGGIYYWFDIYTTKPEDSGNPLPPAGTYSLGEATDEMTFAMDFSSVIQIDEQGNYTYQGYYVDGELTISYEGGDMVVEAFMTDESSYTHHVTFRGKAGYTNEAVEEDDGTLNSDVNMDAQVATALYLSGNESTMKVSIQMTDMAVDDYGYVLPPGSLLTIEAYMPFDENGALADGDYTMSYDGADFTCVPGLYYMDFTGTYIEVYDEYYNAKVGLVSSGSMNVSHSGGNTVIECEFYTEEGYSISASWSGEMKVGEMPGPFSTLTEDYVLDLEGATALAYNYGDYYDTGGNNWGLTINPVDGPDGFQADFVSVTGDFEDGIPSGVYNPSSPDAYPLPGEYMPGYKSGASLYGTVYFGGKDSDGYVTEFAPATSGTMTLTNNGDGTYRIVMDFTDDKGNKWTGEWEGSIVLEDWSYAPQPVSRKIATSPHRMMGRK